MLEEKNGFVFHLLTAGRRWSLTMGGGVRAAWPPCLLFLSITSRQTSSKSWFGFCSFQGS